MQHACKQVQAMLGSLAQGSIPPAIIEQALCICTLAQSLASTKAATLPAPARVTKRVMPQHPCIIHTLAPARNPMQQMS